MTVRVRFAPSPTGYLHMGGVRTGLFNYLFAKNQGGTFVLRVEDTDLERSKPEYTEVILDAMSWLGMPPDEGPYYQTKRFDIYHEKIEELLASGHAYKCFSTPEELEADREKALAEGRKPMYSRKWRDRSDYPEGEPFVVRIKMPLEGTITITDMVQGTVTVDVKELDDFIIARSDGSPTYNFVVVVDDATMDISHVIRGNDHLNNTFRQIPVYRALGYEPPTFGHLPLIDGLSKRKGSMSVQAYREMGFLKEAIVNYVSRLGWSHGDQEIFTMEELEQYFGFDHVGRSSSSFDQDKFLWVNAEWMKRLAPEELASRWLPYLKEAGYDVDVDERLIAITALMRDRANTMVALTEASHYFFSDEVTYDEKASEKWLKPGGLPGFRTLVERLDALSDWTPQTIEAVYKEVMAEFELGMAKVAQPTRIALTGATNSPSVYELVATFDRDVALARLKKGVTYYESRVGDA
ncbi:glutamate--tRNA ligase [Lujinxingia litoralis]|uniref:Glutamate--tRNA ligase n=1 Tax=Lujinxingia litoralis TaxID=2211119 RepID=A0A328C698_9DELT|nr:glutamate--tRNA ligase [Lujinxingia litoralis]RAL21727.1 glutamate--tRNA ligase [Lujinxingia litoralis]